MGVRLYICVYGGKFQKMAKMNVNKKGCFFRLPANSPLLSVHITANKYIIYTYIGSTYSTYYLIK